MARGRCGVAAGGARLMRGGAFKPRTSPYAFQGKGVDGLKLLKDAAARHGLPVVTELMDVRMLDTFLAQKVDVIQIGTRNMQNFDLLKEVGSVDVPVMLKRGMSATISEWLMAAEYIAAGGNHGSSCASAASARSRRPIATCSTSRRSPVLKRETHLPVIVDPSHAGGKAWMVSALVMRGGRRRCRRPAGRSASEPGRGVVRRRPGAHAGGVRDADGQARCGRAGRRTLAGHGPRRRATRRPPLADVRRRLDALPTACREPGGTRPRHAAVGAVVRTRWLVRARPARLAPCSNSPASFIVTAR